MSNVRSWFFLFLSCSASQQFHFVMSSLLLEAARKLFPNSIDRDREENAHDRKKGLVFFPKASSGSNTPTREELLSEYKLAVRTYSSSITLYKLSYRIGGGFSFLPNW